MITTRTPFRFTLGGGGTDLPSYYSKYGGIVFSAAIDKYMYISVNRPVVDDLVRLKHSKSETVENVSELQHDIAKAVLENVGIKNAIEISSMADIPAGTGLGSSSCYAVGLLNALYTLKREPNNASRLASTACHLEMDILKKPVGKQDQYVAAYGGLPIIDIDKSGGVSIKRALVNPVTLKELNRNTLIFYTDKTRDADQILKHQDGAVKTNDQKIIDSLHRIKEIGYKTIEAVESGNLEQFGFLMHEHWEHKKQLSKKITNKRLNNIYDIAKENGALGGKITGAGGGGFFIFYTDEHDKLRKSMLKEGLRELSYAFDMEGSKVIYP